MHLTIDVDMVDSVPAKTLLKLVETVQRMKRMQEKHSRTVQQFSPLFRRLEELDIDVDFELLSYSGDINLRFSGDGDRFAAVWAELRRNGYEPASRPKRGDSTFNDRFKRAGFSSIYVSFSSSICQRVQVGTKLVETPIYETRCGDAAGALEGVDPAPALEASAPMLSAPSDDIPF